MPALTEINSILAKAITNDDLSPCILCNKMLVVQSNESFSGGNYSWLFSY